MNKQGPEKAPPRYGIYTPRPTYMALLKKGLGARRKSLVSKESLGEQEKATRALYEQYRPAGHEGLLLEDLSQALEKLHLPRSRIEEIFKRADTDGDGSECQRAADRLVSRPSHSAARRRALPRRPVSQSSHTKSSPPT